MTDKQEAYAGVAFKRRGADYRASAPLRDLALLRDDPAKTMRAATVKYRTALRDIRQWQQDVEALRRSKTALPAKKAWELGNIVHKLDEELAKHGCQLEDPYGHLERHAGLSPKWLAQYITFRRYVEAIDAIPDTLKWNSIMKSVRSAGEAIASGNTVAP